MATISVSPALAALLPKGLDVQIHWVGVDDTTPAGFFGAFGVNQFGVNTFWLIEGTPETPIAMAGRVSSRTVYGGQNSYLGSSKGDALDFPRIVQEHIRNAARG